MEAIIYGTGRLGFKTFNKYKGIYEIRFFCDSGESKWGDKIHEIEIVSPSFAIEYANRNDCLILIASTYYLEIIEGLLSLGLNLDNTKVSYVSPSNDFLTDFRKLRNIPVEEEPQVNSKTDKKLKKVLFVQEKECTRTFKIASCLKKVGIEVHHAFLRDFDGTGGKCCNTYEKVIRIEDLRVFMDYINDSDYDIIHCSNEPDYLTALLINSNKKVVHDCHDMTTLRGGANITNATIADEYTANKYCGGNLYVTDAVKNYAIHKFGLKNKPVFAINNFAITEQMPKAYKEKLSLNDNEIHCVYEGGLTDVNTPYHHRYIEAQLLAIADSGIHVHFYGAFNNLEKYYNALEMKSPYIHNEGYVDFNKLTEELTQYDLGLALLNINEGNRDFLSTTFPNKIFDYLLAGLPVVASNISVFSEFIASFRCGVTLDFGSDIKPQIRKASFTKIPQTFLSDNRLFMEQNISNLICFYEQVIAGAVL